MGFASVPLALFLLLPGFVLLHVIYLVSRIRRASAFYTTMWSVIGSLALIVILYPIYTFLVAPPIKEQPWPGLLDVMADPSKVPRGVWLLLYLSAVVFGGILGVLDRFRIPERILNPLGIDLRVHGDLWSRLLREDNYSYVLMYLKNGSLISGWPMYFSNDRQPPGPEIYLSPFRTWDPDQENWVEPEKTEGLLIHGSEVSRMEFVSKI